MTTTTGTGTIEIAVPDIGDYTDVPVVEIHVQAGDMLAEDDPVITLESDKATMEIPAPTAGTVSEVLVKVGDQVSQGTPIVLLVAGDGPLRQPPSLLGQQEPEPATEPETVEAGPPGMAPAAAPPPAPVIPADGAGLHAGPAVRRLAREL